MRHGLLCRQSAMALAVTRICKACTSHRNELPVVLARRKHQLQHAIAIVIPCHAIRPDSDECLMALAARPDDELPDSAGGVRLPVRILRREAFIIMDMAIDDDIHSGGVKKREANDGKQNPRPGWEPVHMDEQGWRAAILRGRCARRNCADRMARFRILNSFRTQREMAIDSFPAASEVGRNANREGFALRTAERLIEP